MAGASAKELGSLVDLTAIAQDSRLPVDDVIELYEHEREELAAGARVTTYLQIFAIRNVKEKLRQRFASDAVVD